MSDSIQSTPVLRADEAYRVLLEVRRGLASLSSIHDLSRWSRDYADGADDARALGRMVEHIDRHNGGAMGRLEMAEYRLLRAIGADVVAEWDEHVRIESGATDARSHF